METLKQFHGLPCNCYTRRVLLGLLPDPNADSCPAICSAEIVDGNWTIYPSGTIPSTSTATVQGSIDTGTTWFNITSPLPYNFFDGSNGVPTGQSALYTRLLVTDQYGCESYSVESTVTG